MIIVSDAWLTTLMKLLVVGKASGDSDRKKQHHAEQADDGPVTGEESEIGFNARRQPAVGQR